MAGRKGLTAQDVNSQLPVSDQTKKKPQKLLELQQQSSYTNHLPGKETGTFYVISTYAFNQSPNEQKRNFCPLIRKQVFTGSLVVKIQEPVEVGEPEQVFYLGNG